MVIFLLLFFAVLIAAVAWIAFLAVEAMHLSPIVELFVRCAVVALAFGFVLWIAYGVIG